MPDTDFPGTGTSSRTSTTGFSEGSLKTTEWQSDQGMTSGAPSTTLREQASELREGAKQTLEQVKQYTNESLDKARQQWFDSRQRITERAQGFVQEQKSRLCTGIDGAAQAARAAAEKLEESQDPTVARYARAAVGGLEQVRDYLQAADVSDLAADVRRFTRNHPEWVLGGMFVVGLALARFMKADRPIGPRGLPEGADEDLYRDVYRSQFEDDDADFGLTGEDYGELGGPAAGFTSYYETGTSASPASGSSTSPQFDSGMRPGETGGYNPSGGQTSASGFSQSYGGTAARNTTEGRGGEEQKGTTL